MTLAEALREAVAREFNPFEPNNQSAHYWRWANALAAHDAQQQKDESIYSLGTLKYANTARVAAHQQYPYAQPPNTRPLSEVIAEWEADPEKKSALDRARAQQQEPSDEKDAARLDYIESNARCDPKMDGQNVWWPTSFNHRLTGPTLRAAIDAAMEAQQQEPTYVPPKKLGPKGSGVNADATRVALLRSKEKATVELLQSMIVSAVQLVEGDAVIGYKINTGALHKLVALHPALFFPTNLPSEAQQQEPLSFCECGDQFTSANRGVCVNCLASQQQEPVGWIESPYGAFRANPKYRWDTGPTTVTISIPLYTKEPTP
jgi:hypothetical protein